ncbi:hypothetical protein WMY93_022480 [Mugilogobius chulae]|uniref:PSI domain-containing protein n=1 Tax=Mugilogobius chulae TaxID=88201 RepID=A0AAW0NA43_9GOBI
MVKGRDAPVLPQRWKTDRHKVREREKQCVEARDPYCGWDRLKRRCTTFEESSNMNQWIQNITDCPVRNLTQDGVFGPWAQWQSCSHSDGDGSSLCLCRSRSCDGPSARCGGAACKGPTIQVANCSRNGGWTPWSSWGQCSSSCGIGFEVRQRSCNNPSPRHGGRVCVGQGREERLCNERRPCPLPVSWTSWGPWAKCSSECGGGVHSRSPELWNGSSCPGCATEYRVCNLEACPEVRRNTPWTPWIPVNVSQDGSRLEQRSRYTCRALLPKPQLLQSGKRRQRRRYCPNDGSGACQTDALVEDLVKSSGLSPVVPQGARWGLWETWSVCSRSCSKRLQDRKRLCSTPQGRTNPSACVGSPVEYQDWCSEALQVDGGWSCWSAWFLPCFPCGGGHFQRTSWLPLLIPSSSGRQTPCTRWTDWGDCDENGLQFRTRTCGDSGLCLSNVSQSRTCKPTKSQSFVPGQDNQNCGTYTLFQLIAVGLASFFVAALLSAMASLGRDPPSTPNHLNYNKPGNAAPKNEKYIPMEFKVDWIQTLQQ